jgi:hypothetical protein
VVVNNNNFVTNETGIISYDATPMDATNNWWGSDLGPVAVTDINDYDNSIFTWDRTQFPIQPSVINTDPFLCGPFETIQNVL